MAAVLVHVQVAVPEERILLGSMPADSLQPGDEVNGVLLQPVGYGEGTGRRLCCERGGRALPRSSGDERAARRERRLVGYFSS